MLSKYVGRLTSCIENDITKTRYHSRQRGNYHADCVWNWCEQGKFRGGYFSQQWDGSWLHHTQRYHCICTSLERFKNHSTPWNHLWGTGVYSRRLQAFLEENNYAYTRLNPLEAKKQLDSLRVRKTDKIDAEKLAQSQFVLNRKSTHVQEKVYQDLRDLSRFYQNLTEDTVRTKNRLHKVLQVTLSRNRVYFISANRWTILAAGEGIPK